MAPKQIAAHTVLVALVALGARARADSTLDKLKAGQILRLSVPVAGSGVWAGRAMAVVNAPASAVQQVIASFADYKGFVPRITSSRKVGEGRFVLETSLPWPVNNTWAYLSVRSGTRDGVHVIQWRMLNGNLKRYEGVAWIQPWGASRTLLTYQMLAVPSVRAPDSVMTDGLRDAVGSMVEAVRKQVQKSLGVKVARSS
jgi:ribosome-associated toxin RatA of RatAB toxin-antitoxin module